MTITVTGSRRVWVLEDGITINGNYSSGTRFTGKAGWLRRGTTGGDFVHAETDLSKSGKSGSVTWDLSEAVPGDVYTGKFMGETFTVKVT